MGGGNAVTSSIHQNFAANSTNLAINPARDTHATNDKQKNIREEVDDSFRTEDEPADNDLEDNSLLMKSEFLKEGEGSTEDKPTSSL